LTTEGCSEFGGFHVELFIVGKGLVVRPTKTTINQL